MIPVAAASNMTHHAMTMKHPLGPPEGLPPAPNKIPETGENIVADGSVPVYLSVAKLLSIAA